MPGENADDISADAEQAGVAKADETAEAYDEIQRRRGDGENDDARRDLDDERLSQPFARHRHGRQHRQNDSAGNGVAQRRAGGISAMGGEQSSRPEGEDRRHHHEDRHAAERRRQQNASERVDGPTMSAATKRRGSSRSADDRDDSARMRIGSPMPTCTDRIGPAMTPARPASGADAEQGGEDQRHVDAHGGAMGRSLAPARTHMPMRVRMMMKIEQERHRQSRQQDGEPEGGIGNAGMISTWPDRAGGRFMRKGVGRKAMRVVSLSAGSSRR